MAQSKTQKRTKRAEEQLVRVIERNKIRRKSRARILGLPLYDIAIGPDLDKGELRGHAKGIIAIGDVATGGLALGGIASGGIAIGGLACGLLSVGGLAFGLMGAFGGVALGGVAMGGVAIAIRARGGAEVEPGWFD